MQLNVSTFELSANHLGLWTAMWAALWVALWAGLLRLEA
jgi:hypothetical protein